MRSMRRLKRHDLVFAEGRCKYCTANKGLGLSRSVCLCGTTSSPADFTTTALTMLRILVLLLNAARDQVAYLLNRYVLRSGRAVPPSNDAHCTDEVKGANGNAFQLPNLDRIISLPDGRDLGYAQYGAKDGPTILHFHGFPGSRLEGALYHGAANKVGVRVLSIDRPGIGLSSAHLARSTRTFSDDVSYLVDDLELKSWAIMGISGGGPYALACAHSRPPGLKAIALVAAMGPHDISRRYMSVANRILFHCFEHYAWLVRYFAYFSHRQHQVLLEDTVVNAIGKVRGSKMPQSLKPKSREMAVLSDDNVMRTFWRSSCEFFKQGDTAFCEEGRILTSDQGFDPREIEVPARLWYGKEDVNVGPHMGPDVTERLGDNATLRLEDEGHAGLVVNKAEDILRDLKQLL